ncbi:hypothetical protein GOP47_0014710 [Adiantum capillus-veneris]|uniref:RING-type E3 ubiquitin transferase n=1 Tax=Adiantum capillus-veneris TaxID=13818 RepID=A0A9D4UMH9_ADICA|nr:hypothetical protein GOP47_0014710 [Adiantum capillus-veneris]
MHYLGGSVPENKVSPEIVAAYRSDLLSQVKQDLQAHQRLCCKWKLRPEFVIVEDDNVASSLRDQISRLGANKFVLGKSTSTFLRKFKGRSIPDIILEDGSYPCTVFVISNGKLISMRSARVSPQSSLAVDSHASASLSYCNSNGFSNGALSSSRCSGSAYSAHDECNEKNILFWERGSSLDMASNSHCEDSYQQKNLPVTFNKSKVEQLEQHLQVARQMAAIAKKNAAWLNAYAKEEARMREQAVLEAEAAKEELAKQAKNLEATRLALEVEFQRRKDAEDQASRLASSGKENLANMKYRGYHFEELKIATDGFAPENRIGEGAYGHVYRGTLHHTAVAIKVLKKDSVQGPMQFQREVEFLSHMHHPNIVLLLGACPEQGCLVYECLANGSLEDRLLCKGNTVPLSWQTRCRIIREVATALLFLHSFKPNPYVHRDLKPANILLDQNFVSKLGDVGLVALASSNILYDVTQYKETTPVGTYAYIDPEYKRTGVFTPRSDVYAFGVVMLQILTAKSPLGLPTIVKAAFKENKLDMVLDASAGDWPLHVAADLSCIAIQLCRSKPKKRLDLKDVLPALEKLLGEFG